MAHSWKNWRHKFQGLAQIRGQISLTLIRGQIGSDRIRSSDPIRGQISLTLIEDVMRNFTVKDCQLSGLHLPPGAPPRTSFDPYNICCSLGTYYCPDSTFDEVVGGPTSFASGVTGIGSLIPKGLGQILAACPFGHCKRPSLAKPGKLVCCLLIRAPWAHARIAVCPHSCDWNGDNPALLIANQHELSKKTFPGRKTAMGKQVNTLVRVSKNPILCSFSFIPFVVGCDRKTRYPCLQQLNVQQRMWTNCKIATTS